MSSILISRINERNVKVSSSSEKGDPLLIIINKINAVLMEPVHGYLEECAALGNNKDF